MKKPILSLVFLFIALLASADNRGLWACKNINGNGVFVSWRMRSTDDPLNTTYKLYSGNRVVKTLKDRTNALLSSSYSNATFRLEVLDANGNVIDAQEGVKCDANFFHHINLDYPGDYTMKDGTVVTYTPNDCSAYDMDGDGEQEIIMKWEPSNAGAVCTPTGPQIVDCYKMNGTRLWRIDFGPNVLAGCRFTFLCYDFDGDGKGELIGKTAQGSKDATGEYLHTGPATTADHTKSSVNSSGVITNGGKEWLTVFDGATGQELATTDYWPLFGIQSNWADDGKNDGAGYGHRGNWFKSCVACLDIDGKPTPCAVTVRGIYTYSYAAAYSWDGADLKIVWKHTSDKKGQGIYAQGAHSLTVGDLDGDSFDEVMVGAAAIDHDGTLLWRTGLGHGDATHLGDFDPDNEGLEVFMITEEANAKYDAAIIDAKTGTILHGILQTGGDTGRGLIMDCDARYDGAEFMEMAETNLMTCKGGKIAPWREGAIKSASINYAIYWDGDLLREYHDRSHIDKWNAINKAWDRTCTLYQYGYGANTINGTKYNCCLQCDLYGDWREEAVYWSQDGNNYYLTIFTTTTESQYKLPWLRDDHTYDMAIAWQNCGYNQPPHLGYCPVTYYKQLKEQTTAITGMNDLQINVLPIIYDLQGHQINNTQKTGIYIYQGHKIIKK